MALAVQYDVFEDQQISEMKSEIKDIKESHRKTQKCLFGKQTEVKNEVKICRDFMEMFGNSLVELMNRIEILENASR